VLRATVAHAIGFLPICLELHYRFFDRRVGVGRLNPINLALEAAR
jgi:hypothetical protein